MKNIINQRKQDEAKNDMKNLIMPSNDVNSTLIKIEDAPLIND